MGLFDAIDIAGSGLTAERLRMDVTAENLANAQTTRTADGGPYLRKQVVLQPAGDSFGTVLTGAIGGVRETQSSRGVEVGGIVEDATSTRLVYDPSHPDANAQGYVAMPNVNPVTEMVDLISSSRSYEANVTSMQSAKQMFTKTLELLR
ncbi:flagellar basal body rod protein FlgC [Conexibacter sp. JD483]|uniref:flagellar basal body rod protein FlgC n=1 Tax=unclassified Conexibacter TaxID=2627773 RepID=UPI0027280A49|nr:MULTISPECIES: flagellar basal body rod protein FlgC [unclassified Conexibacter]MDO8184482.1 flagellar basal body rod protein FlgC [Conexibacter sp. CPCC 205706]MDO8197788.1 flagellar basal body rod protein FlgC [Conexibacter sp. CPCC 205762]MDR9368076.1 flagellar basal body rod protein FlgC [Conexibacter sp. JD483]